MLIGKVVGSVVSTRKSENLVGNKCMIVDVMEHMKNGAKQWIAIGSGMPDAPVDAAIVGIIDDGTGLE